MRGQQKGHDFGLTSFREIERALDAAMVMKSEEETGRACVADINEAAQMACYIRMPG